METHLVEREKKDAENQSKQDESQLDTGWVLLLRGRRSLLALLIVAGAILGDLPFFVLILCRGWWAGPGGLFVYIVILLLALL